MWAYVYAVSHALISAACFWAVLSPKVNDGVLGKVALLVMLFASLGCLAWAITWPWEIQRPSALFSGAVAVMAVRCYWIKACRPVRKHIKRRIRKC